MVYSEKLCQFKEVTHGFATKEEGDFKGLRKLNKNVRIISQIETIVHIGDIYNLKDLVLPQQVHGNKIALVRKRDRGKIIKGVDGLITHEREVFLGVTTADCLPILFYEPGRKIVAAIHAGWKGTLKRICQKLVKKIKILGGDAGKTIVAIGPHIQKCCYDIDKKRTLTFKKKFGKEVIIKKTGRSFLDLAKISYNQLLDSGIKGENVEILPYCTYCQSDLFFSYRKGKEKYSEMLSFIALINGYFKN